ncbi:Rieske (2Fe-2S) protein [Streptomyces formicae]|uniref:Cytochrome bc1 complex Rieske iron-sulfur subunit n=1 Tax=Streptomyces formicae TaxID=1616117 RepID=A0A291Q4L8_9ACTN|nr:Rieske (2Fe-2S) protein [Streptomyces formicae]ATL26681.1 putative iron sulfur protein (putative secreted protein) [Streptomyces formicae]
MSGTGRASRRAVIAAGAGALAAGCSKYGDEGARPESSEPASASASSGSDASDNTSSAPASEKPPAGPELARTSDIPVGGGKVFKDEKVVVTQPERGDFRAFSAVCTHQGCTVSEVAGGTINCPCHGSKYRVADASVAGGPAPRPLPPQKITVTGNSITLG